MATQLDHFQNTKARLLERLKELDREAEEIRDLLDANERTMKLLTSGSLPTVSQAVTETPKPNVRKLQNQNITALVREYIDNYAEDAPLNVTSIVRDYLIGQHGAKGNYRSLYAAVHVILKKETQSNQFKSARLDYVKGSGFFKRRQD